jgi:hypothetical protein
LGTSVTVAARGGARRRGLGRVLGLRGASRLGAVRRVELGVGLGRGESWRGRRACVGCRGSRGGVLAAIGTGRKGRGERDGAEWGPHTSEREGEGQGGGGCAGEGAAVARSGQQGAAAGRIRSGGARHNGPNRPNGL